VASVGLQCTSDADCGGGSTCLTATGTAFFGGGTARGTCTIDCTQYLKDSAGKSAPNLPKQYGCDPTVDPNDPNAQVTSVCLNFGTDVNPQGYCSSVCQFGSPANATQLDPNKCRGRDDTVCQPLFNADGTEAFSYCRPFCQADDQCGAGSYCDHNSGICLKGTSALKKNGDSCTYSADPNAPQECSGFCAAIYSQTDPNVPANKKSHGFCVDACEVSSPDACGGPTKGYCLYNFFAPYTDATQSAFVPEVAGDIGGCVKVVKPGDDASCHPEDGYFTYTFPNTTATICDVASPCKTNADCDTANGLTCQASKVGGGSFCLDHKPAL
jgi:hypothetical protein